MPSSLQLVSDEALAKTGMKRSDLAAKVTSAARLASLRLWRVVDGFGQNSEGDYYTVDLMKAPNVADWIELETKIYKAVHEERANNGPIKGWAAYALVLPGGSGQPFNVATVNLLKDLAAIGGPAGYEAAFEKVHPGVNQDWLGERTQKTRDIVQSVLARVIAQVAAE